MAVMDYRTAVFFTAARQASQLYQPVGTEVAVTALSPLATRLLNASLLLLRRPYLLRTRRASGSWLLVRRLAGDGFSYMGAAAIANALVYQWPVYYMARVRPPLESSTFAVYMQLILLLLSLSVSIAQPLWPAVADAAGRADWVWIAKVLRRARAVAVACGVCELLAVGFLMNIILRLWLHRPIHIEPVACWAAGVYVFLATWEYVHWTLALGLGAMRTASGILFWRAVAFAVSVPMVISYGTVGLMVALCISVVATSAWLYPVLLARTFAARMLPMPPARLALGSSGSPASQF